MEALWPSQDSVLPLLTSMPVRVEDGKNVKEAYWRRAVELNLEVGEFLVVDYSQPQRLILGPLADLIFELRRLEEFGIGRDKDGSD